MSLSHSPDIVFISETDDSQLNNHICMLISIGFQIHTTLRIIHLTTLSYSIHKASDSFSTELLKLLDQLAEVSIGYFTSDYSDSLVNTMKNMPMINVFDAYQLKSEIEKYIHLLLYTDTLEFQSPELLNIIHDIISSCRQFFYLIRLE